MTSRAPGAAPPQKERYTVGYGQEMTDFFKDRRAKTHAAFFLPHLRGGMRLLDCGCGPGTITTDLAEIVSPAEAVGIDVEQTQITSARAYAEKRGIHNIRFQVASIYELPFPDGSFDAVFMHGVVEHLKEPGSALKEVHRVLAPGGIAGLRHGDWSGFLFAPEIPLLTRFFEIFVKLIVHNGGDPKSGRNQFAPLHAAGFGRFEASASHDCWTSSPAVTRSTARFLAGYCKNPDFIQQAVTLGLADHETLDEMSAAFMEWAEQPGAFAAEAWGEAVAWKG